MDLSILQTITHRSQLKGMEAANKQALLREGIQTFELHNEIYSLKILYSEKLGMIEMHAEEKKSFEFYTATILERNLPKDLLFFQDVHSIYQFLSANPSQTLSYNIEGKFISIKDYVGKRPKYFNIPLKQRTLTPAQIVELKFNKSEKKAKLLEEENQKLKKELDYSIRKISVLEQQLKEQTETRKIDQIKKEKAEERLEWMHKENRILRDKLRMQQRQEALQDEIINKMIKKRKYSNEKDKTDDETSPMKPLSPIEQEGRLKTITFGQKLSYSIPINQRNYIKFTFHGDQIRKNNSSKYGHMLYFKPRQRLRKRNETQYIRLVKHDLPSYSDRYTLFGLIDDQQIHEINCQNIKKAIFLNVSNETIKINNEEVKLKEPLIWQTGALTMVLQPQQTEVSWFLNENIIYKCKIPVELSKLNLYPFVQLMDRTCIINLA